MSNNFDNVSQTDYVSMSSFFLADPLVYIVSAYKIFGDYEYLVIWSQFENNIRDVS